MKTDNYLTLCLEQAAKSPLHYRHGAIVVRGGKVIGHGYNDYRPGFNGGALKHGRIAHSSMDGDAVKELKSKLKKKKQQKQQDIQQQSTSTFTPFEGTGGGHSVNQPLSMHSEMMAIYSALSASSTLSSTTFSREKPCFKLPRGDKRKARLRRDVLMAYVAAVCETSPCTGKSQVRQEATTSNNNNKRVERNYNNKEDEDVDLLSRMLKDAGVAFHGTQSGEKHHQNLRKRKNLKCHQNEKKKNGQYGQYQYEGQYGRYGKQTQHAHGQPAAQPSASKSVSSKPTTKHGQAKRPDDDDSTTTDDYDDEATTTTTSTASLTSQHNVKCKKDYKRSGKMKMGNHFDEDAAPSQSMLLPKGRVASTTDRKKHPRLQGADLYVTRLGWSGKSSTKPKKATSVPAAPAPNPPADEDPLASSTSSLSTSSSHSGSGSLHDELINREATPSPTPPAPAHDCDFDRTKIHASRPCYRCITFMHSVGIRRVFWTNDAGEWEGGKVSQLVENMDGEMEDVGSGGPMGNGVFVTKHEVLMLRRFMGEKSGGKK